MIFKNNLTKAQALAELTIFGSLFLMLLAVSVSYGLRYQFQQKASQEAFRQALGKVALSKKDGGEGSASYLVYRDNHIPDPGNPFAIGAVASASSSASVTRDYLMSQTADDDASLPNISIDINGVTIKKTTAGFRPETITDGNIDKYRQIYGYTNVDKDGQRVIDHAAGQIMDYDSTVSQCRQIVDKDVCASECEKAKVSGSDQDCSATSGICSQSISTPWYCQDYEKFTGITRYKFKTLNTLFGIDNSYTVNDHPLPRVRMGIQQDYSRKTDVDNQLIRQESAGEITTTDTVDFQDEITREIKYLDGKSAATAAVTSTVACQEGKCEQKH